MRFILLIIILFSKVVAAQSVKPFFKSLRTENGLSHNKVNCILQDRRGFLWFGTEDGLNRYDGRYFNVYKNEPNNNKSVSGNIITDLYEDKEGIIWIATADGGITRYNYRLAALQQFKQFKYSIHDARSIPENGIKKIVEDNQSNLWLATTHSNVVRFNKKTEKFDVPVKTGPKSILSMVMGKNDTLLTGRAGGGLLKINTRTLASVMDVRYKDLYAKLPHASVSSLFIDSKDMLWFSSWDNKVYNYSAKDHLETVFKNSNSSSEILNDEIMSFAEDKKNQIWMAGKNTGITLYDQKENMFYNYRYTPRADGVLANDHTNTVYVDRKGIVWVGTNNGLSIYDPLFSPFVQHYLPDKGQDIIIYDFYKDDQQLYIGTSNGIYIKSLKDQSYTHKKITYKGQSLSVTKFFIDQDKTFYIGTDYTLFKYDLKTNRIATLPNTESDPVMKKLISSRIVSIVRDTIDHHPVLMVSPYGHYLTYYDLKDQRWVSRADSAEKIIRKYNIKDNLVRKFFQDKKGGLWLATNKFGLGDWQQKFNFPIKYYMNELSNSSSISNNDVFDIKEDENNNFWISTYGGGLNYFNPKNHKFEHINESSNLTEGLAFDWSGNLWMICNGHIHRYDPVAKIYSCYDMPNVQKSGGVKGYVYTDDQNNLYVSGVNYYVSFRPEKVARIENELAVYLTDFKIFNNSFNQLLQNKTIELDHVQNYFSFEFSAPDYTGDNIQYSYMLEGIDQEWVDAGKRNYANYSNLPGGTYLFKVRASNWKGSTIEKFTSIKIHIIPPFWRRWWFYVMILMIVISLAYLIYYYRINELLKRQSIRNGIAHDLHDHVGATLSSILIYSEVAKNYYEQEKTVQLKQILNTIGETADDMIGEVGDIVWAINPKNDHLGSIIQRVKFYAQPLCMAKNIKFEVNSDPKLDGISLGMPIRKNLFLILKEAINNAIKYSACKNLTIDVRLQYKIIKILIRDDGIGFVAGAPGAKAPNSLSGNGLINMKFRMEELSGQMEINSIPGEGTLISLSFNIDQKKLIS